MTDSYYHGIELVEIDDGIRPITTVRTSVIGLLGTAPADTVSLLPAGAETTPWYCTVAAAGSLLSLHPRQTQAW